ncbi:MAG: hypothetical protein LBP51_02455, partial [Deferribacteraceae bacterium]|nr:hypothetical protein [Deferribacteraceae bacterium]
AVLTDYDRALELFDIGLLNQNADALFFVGVMKYYGLGLAKNEEEGLADITQAAERGSVYAYEQLKRFLTEDALDYLRGVHSREDIKTYLLSIGASLEGSEESCDLYGLQSALNSDYALVRAKVCFGAASRQIIFEYQKAIDPLYKSYLDNYMSLSGYSMIPISN